MNEIEVESKPRRAQEGKGLLSRSIHVQSLHKSMAKIPNSREERRWTERRRAPGSWGGGRRFLLAHRREERGEGIFKVPT